MPRQQLGKARPRTIKEQISPQIAGDYRVGASSLSSVNIVLKVVLLLLSYWEYYMPGKRCGPLSIFPVATDRPLLSW